MKATDWEFANRALIFGFIFAIAFPLYALDHQNSAAVLAKWLAAVLAVNANHVARFIFAAAAVVLFVAALIRTWAAAYLHAGVVYAATVKTDSLVADGPYRRVRNPLYLANILMAAALGAMMSRAGYVVVLAGMGLFCYRLILREEAELETSQGERYARYRRAVPRLWPSVWPRVPSAGGQGDWAEGFKAEFYYWGFAAALAGFAITLSVNIFFAMLSVSLAVLWMSSAAAKKRPKAKSSGH
ncbi:MAG TPA: isoprenylcysteine carboxylmethyltransferase family protein [Candidatus Limnocylindrales bacterium]|nr:isoprenylcysteine carboxylmethyltransferase family protein [Candidatus Limnocylindrales bacterium]